MRDSERLRAIVAWLERQESLGRLACQEGMSTNNQPQYREGDIRRTAAQRLLPEARWELADAAEREEFDDADDTDPVTTGLIDAAYRDVVGEPAEFVECRCPACARTGLDRDEAAQRMASVTIARVRSAQTDARPKEWACGCGRTFPDTGTLLSHALECEVVA
jgi:hypothetical protein